MEAVAARVATDVDSWVLVFNRLAVKPSHYNRLKKCLRRKVMPVISRFFGIIITMYWNDHNPAHFHAQYGEHEVLISLNGVVMEGKIPRRALSMVLEWLALHRDELLENWMRCKQRKPLLTIEPLE